jgi:zona occludens toxin (predicted ATPase)
LVLLCFFHLVVLIALVSMNPERVLIWNVRGLNSSARQDSVRSLVASSKIDIICLQETKLDVVPSSSKFFSKAQKIPLQCRKLSFIVTFF